MESATGASGDAQLSARNSIAAFLRQPSCRSQGPRLCGIANGCAGERCRSFNGTNPGVKTRKTLGIPALATLAIAAISIAAETAVSITAPGLNVGSVTSAKAVLTDSNGSTIETATLGKAFHGTVVASTTTTDVEMGDSITVTLAGGDWVVESKVTHRDEERQGPGHQRRPLEGQGHAQRPSLQAILSTDLDTYSTVTATITLFDGDGVEIESASGP